MAGAQKTLTAGTIEELEAEVERWYEEAEGAGLGDARLPWDPEAVIKTEDGYAFHVWAHS
jgi:hypothetical protein